MTSLRSPRTLLRVLLLSAVMLVAFASPSAASVSTLYAATGSGNASAKLYTLDSSTGAATLVGNITIGATQVTHLTGLAVDPTDGTMYGFANGDFCCDPDFEDGTLMTINKTTGAATVIGTLGGVELRASDMTFDRFGTLYAWSAGCSGDVDCDTSASDLFTLDTSTGAASRVGESGTVGFTTGIASDSKGRMFVKDFESIFQVSPFTGHAFAPADFSPCCSQPDNILSFGPGDVLYTGDRTGSGLQLQTISPATGVITNVGSPNGIQQISAIDWDFSAGPGAPDEADLSLGLSVTNSAPTAETNVTFTLNLVNGNADSATGVIVKDLLPSGFTFVDSDTVTGSYDDSTGTWNVGTLGPANGATLDIEATVHSTGIHTNTAEVTQTGTYDTDSVPGSSEGDTFDAARSAPAGATALYASSGTGSLFCDSEGNAYEDGSASSLYELDPSDGDFRKVADVKIGATDALHVSGLAVHPSTGVLYGFINTQVPVDCNDTPQGPGTLITIDKITGAATVVGSMGAATIASPDISFDPFGTLYSWNAVDDDLYTLNTTTGTASKVGECDCFLNGRRGLAVDSGGRMYLKTQSQLFRVNQFTGALLSQVVLTDFSPRDMLAFGPNDELYTGSRNTFNYRWPQTFGLWTIDPSDGTTTLLGTNELQNMSALAWDLGTITAPDQADLSLTKDVNDSTPDDWFQEVTFTITVSNDGPDDATDVEVSDLLPSGLNYVSDDGGGGYDSVDGIWNAGTITNGNSKSLEIVASVQTTGSYTNTAEVTGSSTYDTDSVPGSGAGDTFDTQTVTPTADPQVDAAADVIVSGPSKSTATAKAFTVAVSNVGEVPFTLNPADVDESLNGDEGAAECTFSSTVIKPGRKARLKCSANIASVGVGPGDGLNYSATVNVPGDGFTNNDTDQEVRTAK